MPLLDRKKRLVRLLGGRRLGIVLSDHTEEDGATIFRQPASWARVIVSKRLPALQIRPVAGLAQSQEPGRSGDDPGARRPTVTEDYQPTPSRSEAL
jgi:hypothetical protein